MAREFGITVRGCAIPFGKVASWNGMHEYIKPTALSTFLLRRPTVVVQAYEHAGRVLGVARLHTSSAGLWFEVDLQDRDVAVCASIARGWNGCSVNFTARRFKLEGPHDVQAVWSAEIDHLVIGCDSAVYAPHAVCWRSDVGYDALPWRLQVMEDRWHAARAAYIAPPPYRPRAPRAAAPVASTVRPPLRRLEFAATALARAEQHFRDFPTTPLPLGPAARMTRSLR